jgi:hypothetical protein
MNGSERVNLVRGQTIEWAGGNEPNYGLTPFRDSFPLTPALSLWERENRSPSLSQTCRGIGWTANRTIPNALGLFLLPEGEGQDEGEGDTGISWRDANGK